MEKVSKKIDWKDWVGFLVLLSLLVTGCGRPTPSPVGADALPEAVPDIVGVYVVNGYDPTGIEYSGTLRILAGDQPATYQLQWVITGSIQEGTGVLQGNVLEVQWHSSESIDREISGTARFTVTVNRELYGVRTTDGYPQEGTETAYPND